jgi:16S rRNA (uracil1498-N3)-methyltransferase
MAHPRPHLPRFLIDRAAAPGDAVPLPADEAKHARVRRLGVGDVVALFDGAGHSYVARLESLSRAGAVVRITESLPDRDGESPLHLTLAVAALKADRLDWVIEKATELGVASIQPFTSARTLARPSRDRQTRWRQIALGAAKQCGRSAAPSIASPSDFAAVLNLQAAAHILFAEDGSGTSLAGLALAAPRSLCIIVGAEGGFTAEELAAARARGCHLAGLGPRVLRAETAAITAVSLCQARWGDLAAPAPASPVQR